MEKRSTMVRTIKVSSYISLKYVQIVRKTVRDLRNNNSKAIDIHHDQGIRNLVESPWKCIVCWAKQQQVLWITRHTIKDKRSKFKMEEIDLYWE